MFDFVSFDRMGWIELAVLLLAVGVILFFTIRRFKHWVFCRSGFFEAKSIQTLDDKRFDKYAGYLYLSPRASLFRQDCCSERAFNDKVYALRQSILTANPGKYGVDSVLTEAVYPFLLTRTQAEALNLNVEAARRAALTWWNTGYIRNRPTPTNESIANLNQDKEEESYV